MSLALPCIGRVDLGGFFRCMDELCCFCFFIRMFESSLKILYVVPFI